MSESLYQQAPPVSGASEHDSIGPVVGVLVAVIVLGAIAVVVGRLCSGRHSVGHVHYDLESWAERKCSSCIDGRIFKPSVPQETKQAEQSSQN